MISYSKYFDLTANAPGVWRHRLGLKLSDDDLVETFVVTAEDHLRPMHVVAILRALADHVERIHGSSPQDQ